MAKKSLIMQLQDFVWKHEGGKVSISKAQSDECVRLVLRWMNLLEHWPVLMMIKDARKREKKRKPRKGK